MRLAIAGACGQMGTRLVHMIADAKDLKLAAAVERPSHPDLGKDIGELAGRGRLGVPLVDAYRGGADVLLNFTVANDGIIQTARACAETKTALVVATTLLSKRQTAAIKQASRKIPCIISPNMSIGVNLLFEIAPQVARLLGDDYDIEIIETHHRFKKDAPSGTAVKLADKVAEAVGRTMAKVGVYGRHGDVGQRTKKEIGVHAVRGGDVVGDHTIVFAALGERIEITHRAHSRDLFARGALNVARFLVGRKPGMYDMADVLKTQ
ncbi:MAG: 4-hydroxy-tetrahydrodipicolinate reductase [Planctomycetota bacterium]